MKRILMDGSFVQGKMIKLKFIQAKSLVSYVAT